MGICVSIANYYRKQHTCRLMESSLQVPDRKTWACTLVHLVPILSSGSSVHVISIILSLCSKGPNRSNQLPVSARPSATTKHCGVDLERETNFCCMTLMTRSFEFCSNRSRIFVSLKT